MPDMNRRRFLGGLAAGTATWAAAGAVPHTPARCAPEQLASCTSSNQPPDGGHDVRRTDGDG